MRITIPRAARRGLTVCVTTLTLFAAPLLAQNPVSDNVVFLHGLLADSMSWRTTAYRLAQEFQFTPRLYSINYFPAETQQAQTLASDLTTLPSGMGAVAKSNGALLVRTYLQNPGKINRFITVAGPNLGAPLADNVLSGRVFLFPKAAATDLATTVNFFAQNDPNIPSILEYGYDALASIFNFLSNILRILSDYGLVLRPLAAQYAPVALDLSPSSTAVANLNSTAGLQKAATAASSRAYIAADFGPPRDILFYTLVNNYAPFLSNVRWTTFAVALGLYSHYTFDLNPYDPDNFLLRNNAYRWGNVANDMLDIDPYWLDMIGALRAVSGNTILYDSSDGIVPVKNAVLLGATKSFRAGPTSHQILNDDPTVYQELRQTMSTQFGIPTRTTPVNSVTITPGGASIAVAKTTQLTARAVDVAGNVVTGHPSTWTSAAPAVATVSSSGLVTGIAVGTTTVTGKVDGYSGTATIVVTPAPPPGITSVTISGATQVRGGQQCSWTASPAGGTGPYSYRWTKNGVVIGDDLATVTFSTPASNFTLGVTATDSRSSSLSTSRTISVSSSAALCGPHGPV